MFPGFPINKAGFRIFYGVGDVLKVSIANMVPDQASKGLPSSLRVITEEYTVAKAKMPNFGGKDQGHGGSFQKGQINASANQSELVQTRKIPKYGEKFRKTGQTSRNETYFERFQSVRGEMRY
jgi:hypothetical protein